MKLILNVTVNYHVKLFIVQRTFMELYISLI